MAITLLNKIKPFNGEALTSYLQRLAKANHMSCHELWRLSVSFHARYPQSSMASLLDYVCSSVLNVQELAGLANLRVNDIKAHTFEPSVRKLLPKNFGDKEVLNSRISSGCFSNKRRYCPECLKEESYYKLIWQVQEVDYCPIHKVKLFEQCPNCNEPIGLFSPNSQIDFCEHCGFQLSYAKGEYVEAHIKSRAHQDWECLMDTSIETELLSRKEVSLKILYLLEENQKFNVDNGKKRLGYTSLLQTARESRSTPCFTHIQMLLDIIREIDISAEEFFEIEVPEKFNMKITSDKQTIKEAYSCQAPWCTSFKKPGSLKRTATSKKKREDGKELHYYMYCEHCGSEYAIDKTLDALVERGYFIKLAFNLVKPKLEQGLSRRETARILGVPEDKIRRCAIFLYANGILDKSFINLELPNSPDTVVMEKILDKISNAKKAKETRLELGLGYNDFLYYWFQPQVMLAKIGQLITLPKRGDKEAKRTLVEVALNYLEENNKKITISNIAQFLKVCPETLRYWGVLEQIEDRKKKVRKMSMEKEKVRIIHEAENIIQLCKYREERILSDDLYKMLKVKRTVLVRSLPEVTKKITQLLKTLP